MTNGSSSVDEQFPKRAGDSSQSKLSAVVSWAFILATILFLQTPQYKALRKPVPDSGPDLQLQLVGKYIVGTMQLLGSRPELRVRMDRMVRDLQKNQSTRKKLPTIPILAELSGKEAAIFELNRLAVKSSDPSLAREISLFLQLYRDGESSLDLQQRLSIKRYGWIGQLALSQNKPASDAARKAVLQSAFATTILLGLAMIGILAALAAGFVLLAVAIVLRARGRLRSHLLMPEKPGISLLQAFSIYLTGYVVLPALGAWLFPKFRLLGALLALLAVVAAIFWPRFMGSDWRSYRAAIGWRRGQGIFREVGAGILGYIAGLPLLLCAAVIVMMLSRYAGKMPVHPIIYEVSRGPLYLLLWFLLACVWAPVVEETLFRGALFGYLRRHVSWFVSGISSAILFAIVHPQGWIGVPLIAAIGFTLSAIREWRGSIIASMSAHALNNGSVLLLLILALN
jgi:membrane protease YdiL (CAAX protease family)